VIMYIFNLSPERAQLSINLYIALSGLRNGDTHYVGRCPTLYNASLSGLKFSPLNYHL